MYINRLRGILLQFGGLVNRRELQVYKERLLAQNLREHPVELAANDASRLYTLEHRAALNWTLNLI